MGLGKSKAPKPGQANTFGNQSGFASNGQSPFANPQLQNNGFPGQSPFGQAPNFATGGFAPPPNSPPFGAQQGGGFPAPNQMGFPPFPPQPPQAMGGFPPSTLFQTPLVGPPMPQSSGYPVSYQNQTFRPLIPGYAPAPSNDRRANMMSQEQEQSGGGGGGSNGGEFSNRYYSSEQHLGQIHHQMPPMNQVHSVKSRKH